MAGKHGGARPGAGNKPGVKFTKTLAKEAARELLRQEITAHLQEMMAAQIANAQGIKYLVGREKATGKFTRLKQEQVEAVLDGKDDTYAFLEVWEKDPSVQAWTDLVNRAVDKPAEQKQVLEITGELSLVAGKLLHARKRISAKD